MPLSLVKQPQFELNHSLTVTLRHWGALIENNDLFQLVNY